MWYEFPYYSLEFGLVTTRVSSPGTNGHCGHSRCLFIFWRDTWMGHYPVGKVPQYLPCFLKVLILLPGKWICCRGNVLFQADGRIPFRENWCQHSNEWYLKCTPQESAREPWLGVGYAWRRWRQVWESVDVIGGAKKTRRGHTWGFASDSCGDVLPKNHSCFSFCLFVPRHFIFKGSTWEPRAKCPYCLRRFSPIIWPADFLSQWLSTYSKTSS